MLFYCKHFFTDILKPTSLMEFVHSAFTFFQPQQFMLWSAAFSLLQTLPTLHIYILSYIIVMLKSIFTGKDVIE